MSRTSCIIAALTLASAATAAAQQDYRLSPCVPCERVCPDNWPFGYNAGAEPCIEPVQPVAVAPAPAPAPPPATLPPTFDPQPGTFSSPQRIALSSETAGAVIHYTTDGSEPTAASPVYTAPIPVTEKTTIRAFAVAPGATESAAASGVYAVELPPPPAPRVVVAEKKLELKDVIYFETAKAKIKPESYSLLDEVASVLQSHPEVSRLSIEGHTDNVGKKAYNARLSQDRAQAVRAYLVEKGVASDRLDAKGYGEDRPIADNKTPKGRETNRRVEFMIEPAK